MDPTGFQTTYMGSTTYACTTAVLAPLRFGHNEHEAAKQQSWLLTLEGCPFQHETCSSYCYLYGGSCTPASRINTYQPSWLAVGENIASGSTTAYGSLVRWLV
jgi:hypothetical protein